MGSDKKAFSVRMEIENYTKLNAISKKNKRSMAMELEYIVEKYFEWYELQYGPIIPEPKANISTQQVISRPFFSNN